MQGLQSLGRDRTLIFVAHRLTTVQSCDTIYLFSGGVIEGSGTHAELTATNSEFPIYSGRQPTVKQQHIA